MTEHVATAKELTGLEMIFSGYALTNYKADADFLEIAKRIIAITNGDDAILNWERSTGKAAALLSLLPQPTSDHCHFETRKYLLEQVLEGLGRYSGVQKRIPCIQALLLTPQHEALDRRFAEFFREKFRTFTEHAIAPILNQARPTDNEIVIRKAMQTMCAKLPVEKLLQMWKAHTWE